MNTVRCPLQSGDEGAALLSYLDRRLDPDSMRALDRHVAICHDCARVVEAQRVVWRALDEWEPVALSADFDERVMARIAREEGSWWRRVVWPGFGRWRAAVPLAAACSVVLAVAVWRGPDRPLPAMEAAEAQQVEDTLADVDMLRQLGLTETPAADASSNSL